MEGEGRENGGAEWQVFRPLLWSFDSLDNGSKEIRGMRGRGRKERGAFSNFYHYNTKVIAM